MSAPVLGQSKPNHRACDWHGRATLRSAASISPADRCKHAVIFYITGVGWIPEDLKEEAERREAVIYEAGNQEEYSWGRFYKLGSQAVHSY